MCDTVVDNFLAVLKFVPELFITSKMIKIFFTAFYADKSILYFNKDSSNAFLICNEINVLNIDLIIEILLFLSDIWLAILNLKNEKDLKKLNEELMAVAWHPNRQYEWCMSEDDKNEIDPIFIKEI